MSGFPWYRLPSVELVRFKSIDFFPPRASGLERAGTICIGSKTRTVGDAMMLTTLPEKLKARYPGLQVRFYPRGFNPVVFHGNPHVDGPSYLPDRVYGDDNNWGEGHLIQLKERCFELPLSEPPRPRLYLTEAERAWALERLGIERRHRRDLDRSSSGAAVDAGLAADRPVCVLHSWGHTWTDVLGVEVWKEIVRRHRKRVRFWQVGLLGQPPIPECDGYLMASTARRNARRLFALIQRASLFIGVNSGPMHAARAFDVPSLIFTREGSTERIFENRRRWPYFLHGNQRTGFLYEENEHFDLADAPAPEKVIQKADAFIERSLAPPHANPLRV